MKYDSGFSLIELLVGMVIGLLGLMVIVQVTTGNEGQRRISTQGMDSLLNGQLALYDLQRKIGASGYGLTANANAIGCNIRMKYGSGSVTSLNLTPVVIINGASGAPDSIRVLASTSDSWAIPIRIVANHPPTAANFFVDSDIGIKDQDLLLAVPQLPDANNWCTVVQSTKTASSSGAGGGAGQNQILHNPSSDWNPPGGANIMPTGGYKMGDYLINLGQFQNVTYSINNKTLHSSALDTSDGTTESIPVYADIVNLQAQYGLDNGASGGTANDGKVDEFTDVSPTSAAAWRQLLAVRVALLSRSQQWEKKEITTTAPSWQGGEFTMSSVGDDWRHYRYKVFQTTIPLRNMLWQQ